MSATPELLLTRVRSRGPARDAIASRLWLERVLAGDTGQLPGVPAGATLLVRDVRQLSTPPPLRVGPAAPALLRWRAALRAALSDAARAAARPARGPVPANAAAVLFADDAELLAAMATDWLERELSERWWWQALWATGDAGVRVLAAWLGRARAAPAAIELLARSNRHVAFVRELGTPRSLAVADAIGVAWGIGAPFDTPTAARVGAARGSRTHGEQIRPPWRRVAPELSTVGLPPAPELLAGFALMLARSPAAATQPSLRGQLRLWLTAAEETAGPLAGGPVGVVDPADAAGPGVEAAGTSRAPASADSGWPTTTPATSRPMSNPAGGGSPARAPDAGRGGVSDTHDALAMATAGVGDGGTATATRPASGPAVVSASEVTGASPAMTPSARADRAPRVAWADPGAPDERRPRDQSGSGVGDPPVGAAPSPPTGSADAVGTERADAVLHVQPARGVRPGGSARTRQRGPGAAAGPQAEIGRRSTGGEVRDDRSAATTGGGTGIEVERELDGGAVVRTGLGGVFYLLGVALRLGQYGDFTQPRHPGLRLSPWEWVTLIARRLLPRARRSDPVWALLARLADRPGTLAAGRPFIPPGSWRIPRAGLAELPDAGRPWIRCEVPGRLVLRHPEGFIALDVPSGPDPEARLRRELARLRVGTLAAGPGPPAAPPLERWIGWVAGYVGSRVQAALGSRTVAAAMRTLVYRPATVTVSPTTVDVHFRLDDLPLALRFAGFDRDPGWVPAAGRTIAYHFD